MEKWENKYKDEEKILLMSLLIYVYYFFLRFGILPPGSGPVIAAAITSFKSITNDVDSWSVEVI